MPYSREECLEALLGARDELGDFPGTTEYMNLDGFEPKSHSPFYNHFETWTDAKEAALRYEENQSEQTEEPHNTQGEGLDTENLELVHTLPGSDEFSQDEWKVVRTLRDIVSRKGKLPTPKDVSESESLISKADINEQFGDFETALAESNCRAIFKNVDSWQGGGLYSKSSVLNAISYAEYKTGSNSILTRDEYTNVDDELPALKTIRQHIEWTEAKRKLQLPLVDREATARDYEEAVRNVAVTIGEAPDKEQFNAVEDELSWDSARDALGSSWKKIEEIAEDELSLDRAAKSSGTEERSTGEAPLYGSTVDSLQSCNEPATIARNNGSPSESQFKEVVRNIADEQVSERLSEEPSNSPNSSGGVWGVEKPHVQLVASLIALALALAAYRNS